jgi:hypothetical protein
LGTNNEDKKADITFEGKSCLVRRKGNGVNGAQPIEMYKGLK